MFYILLACYVLCCVLSYGIMFASFQDGFPTIAEEEYRTDMFISMLLSLGGPLSLLTTLFSTGFAKQGIKFR